MSQANASLRFQMQKDETYFGNLKDAQIVLMFEIVKIWFGEISSSFRFVQEDVYTCHTIVKWY